MKGGRSKAETKKAHSNTWLCNPPLAAETSWKDVYGGGFKLEMAPLLQCQEKRFTLLQYAGYIQAEIYLIVGSCTFNFRTDLTAAVGADLQVMESDAVRMRDGGPFIFAQVKNGV